MKLRLPNYYKDFKCIASKCNHSCCQAGWEIDIDEKSLKFYQDSNNELNRKLNENIILEPTPHFKLNENGTCPFLNENKLCELYLNFGENSLCDICAEHPRYYEFFKDLKEGGIGLCCEEASRIILTQTAPFSTYEIDISYEESDEYNEELFDYLIENRKKIFNYLNDSELSLNSKLKNILWFANTIQQNIDFNFLDKEEIFSINSNSKSSIYFILEFFTTLEPNDQNWIPYLKNSIEIYNNNTEKYFDFKNSNPNINLYLNNIAIYFIWRYFLKGTFDEEILSKVKFMVVSIGILNTLFFCKWLEKKSISLEDCIDITRRYSEEIEYSEDNLYAFAEATYNLDFLTTENLLNILK